MLSVGYGKIKKRNGHAFYSGTLPKMDQEEPVVVLRQSDLELIMHAEEMILLRFPYTMEKELYERRVIETRRGLKAISPEIVDELIYNAPDGTKHKLFLDHHLYSHNPRDALWTRWVSVDQAFMEEGTG
jgi:hypothetical protein